MTTGETLGGEDIAWLRMEQPSNPMVVNGVLELATRLSVDEARGVFERLVASPRLRSKLVPPRFPLGRPAWVPASDFDVADHVERVELDRPGDLALRELLGAAVSSRLDPSRPLWKVYWIDRPGAGTTVLFRVHHAMADGFALLRLLSSVCDDGALLRQETGGARAPHRRMRAPVRASVRALRHLVTLPPDGDTALKRAALGEKRVAWSEPLALSEVKTISRFASATVNDVLVAVAAGALGRYLRRQGESTSGLELHAMVPVNLRPDPSTDATLGNRFGLIVLGLPIGIEDPLERVKAVRQRMQRLKRTPEAAVTYGLLHGMGWAPQRVEDVAVRFFAKKASLVLTNVPGPRQQMKLAGIPITRMMFWVPQASRVGLGLSIFSYAGDVTVGVLSDAGVVPFPDALVADLHAELVALEAEVRAAGSAQDACAAITATISGSRANKSP